MLYYCACEEVPCVLTLEGYDSNNLVDLSDHRPVFAQFLLKLDLSSVESEAEQNDEPDNVSKASNLSKTSRLSVH